MAQELILASESPKRLALLKKIYITPTKIFQPQIDEAPLPKERAFALVKRLSLAKLARARSLYNNSYIIAADTVVKRGNSILGKPNNIKVAETFLKLLSGRKHEVVTGVSVCNPEGKTATKVISTTVAFKRLELVEINNYLKTEEWVGKAGGYSIDGYAELFVKQIIGSYSNILGLPTLTTYNLLKGLGYIYQYDHN